MNDYFYWVGTVYDDCEVTFGYFKSFARAYAASVEFNEDCGNDVPDNDSVWYEIEHFGRSSIGCHTICRIEFSD